MTNEPNQKKLDGAVERLHKLSKLGGVWCSALLLVVWGAFCLACALWLPAMVIIGARPCWAELHIWPVVVLGLGVLAFGFALPAVLLHSIARIVRDD